MTRTQARDHRVDVKESLARKYEHLANLTKSLPRKRNLSRRAARLRQQAAEISRRG